MWSKTIFVVATLCVVNGSVIPANVLDGEVAEDCKWQVCDQLCRRLGFGRCECDDFRAAEEELQSSVESEDVSSVRSCNYRECEQRCRRLKFPGGACVNGRCKCDNFRNAEEQYSAARNCNPQECNQRCRRLKFPGGACVKGRCKCDNFRNADDVDATDDEVERSNLVLYEDVNVEGLPSSIEEMMLSSCNPQECNQRCRRLKFPGGACVNGRCKCDKFRNANDIFMRSEDKQRSCNYRICNQQCERFGYPGGVCINEYCACKQERGVEVELEEPVSVSSCNYRDCQQRCRRIGYSGTCVGGRCKCYSRSAEAAVSDTDEPVMDVSNNSRVRNCNLKVCNRICRLRYKSGTCVNGKCQCSNTDVPNTTTQNPVTELMEETIPLDNPAQNEIEQSNNEENK